jgi:hypothetical protein
MDVGDIHWVECKCVNRPDVVYIFDILPVALECIFLVLGLGTWVEILHADTALHRTNRITYA